MFGVPEGQDREDLAGRHSLIRGDLKLLRKRELLFPGSRGSGLDDAFLLHSPRPEEVAVDLRTDPGQIQAIGVPTGLGFAVGQVAAPDLGRRGLIGPP